MPSPVSCVLVAPTDLTDPTQQQTTVHGGLYVFGVKKRGDTSSKLIQSGQLYSSPSILTPAQSRFILNPEAGQNIVDEALPSADSDTDRTYYLGYDMARVGTAYGHNHIALDPLSALIDIDKRSYKREVFVGDVVTYELNIINRSSVDLTYDPRRKQGGVRLQDVLPKGLKYVAGSAVWSRVVGGQKQRFSPVTRQGHVRYDLGATSFEMESGLMNPLTSIPVRHFA